LRGRDGVHSGDMRGVFVPGLDEFVTKSSYVCDVKTLIEIARSWRCARHTQTLQYITHTHTLTQVSAHGVLSPSHTPTRIHSISCTPFPESLWRVDLYTAVSEYGIALVGIALACRPIYWSVWVCDILECLSMLMYIDVYLCILEVYLLLVGDFRWVCLCILMCICVYLGCVCCMSANLEEYLSMLVYIDVCLCILTLCISAMTLCWVYLWHVGDFRWVSEYEYVHWRTLSCICVYWRYVHWLVHCPVAVYILPYVHWRVFVYTYIKYLLRWHWCFFILTVLTLDELVSSR